MATGHLRKRGDSWLVTVELDKDEYGERQRKYRTIKGTKKEANSEMYQMMAELESGAYIEPTAVTLGAYLKTWLDSKRPNLAIRTYESYEMIVTKHLIPAMGRIRIERLQPLSVENYKNEKLKDHSNRTAQYHLSLLRQALDTAIKLRIIKSNPCDAVEMPRPERKKIKPLTPEQANHLLEVAESHREYPIIFCALRTGMRLGELLGLLWENVDTKNNVIKVRTQLQRTQSKGIILRDVLKSSSGHRNITVTEQVIEILKAYRIVGVKYVFCLKDGRSFDPKNTSDAFRRIALEAGLEGVRFHDLRHTHISHLLAAGVPLPKVQKRAGHERPSTTLDIYGHVIPSEDDGIADVYELYLKSQEDGRQTGDK